LTVIASFALSRSLRAPKGKLREALLSRRIEPGIVEIREAARVFSPDGRWRYEAAKSSAPNTIEIQVDFPSIREGDSVAETNAIVAAMTLNNKGGQIVGIDEKEGVKLLYRSRGVEKGDEIAEQQYPSKGPDKYDPNRTKEELPPPIQKLQPQPGPQPAPAAVPATVATQTGIQPTPPPMPAKEALKRAANRVLKALRLLEAQDDGDD
jgi:hypothetical protein